ncbi:MAG: HepT-like ribonuclease domain-containing protein [Burkholderiales bacterium]
MRREGLYLQDIVDAADAIGGFLQGRTKGDFLNDDFFRSAVLQKLIVIGEAAAKLSDSMRSRYPEVPRADVVGFRNRVSRFLASRAAVLQASRSPSGSWATSAAFFWKAQGCSGTVTARNPPRKTP